MTYSSLACRGRRRTTLIAVFLLALATPTVWLGAEAAPAPSAASAADMQGARVDSETEDAALAAATLGLQQSQTKLSQAQDLVTQTAQAVTAARTEATRREATLARAQHDVLLADQATTDVLHQETGVHDQRRALVRSLLMNGTASQLDAIGSMMTPGNLADRLELTRRISIDRRQQVDALSISASTLTQRGTELQNTRGRAVDTVRNANLQVGLVVDAEGRAQAAAHRVSDLEREQQSRFSAVQQAAATARLTYTRLQDASARIQLQLASNSPTTAQTTAPGSASASASASTSGFIVPTAGVFTSPFGYRVDPFGLGRKFHAGQDIAAPTGTPIMAATAGTVALVQTPDQSGGYGNYTCINRGDGLATCYAHQSAVFVHQNQPVKQGDVIGLVGSTGASTGPHLHFEVRLSGVPVDPMPYLPK